MGASKNYTNAPLVRIRSISSMATANCSDVCRLRIDEALERLPEIQIKLIQHIYIGWNIYILTLCGHNAIATAFADFHVLHARPNVRLTLFAHETRVRQPRQHVCAKRDEKRTPY